MALTPRRFVLYRVEVTSELTEETVRLDGYTFQREVLVSQLREPGGRTASPCRCPGTASRRTGLLPRFEASMGLARRLGLRWVAKGVETVDKWGFLRRSGCDGPPG